MPSKKTNPRDCQPATAPAEPQETGLPVRFRWNEPVHVDDEVIPSLDALYTELVPPWKGDQFDPNVMNAGTGKTFVVSHHKKGAGAKTKSDFKDGAFAFCLEFRDVPIQGKIYRVRCLSQFCTESNQCTTHGRTIFKDGPNSIYQRLAAGEIVTYGDIKDTLEQPVIQAPTPPEEVKKAAKAEIVVVEQKFSEGWDSETNVDHLYAPQAELQAFLSGKTKLLKAVPAPLLVHKMESQNEARPNSVVRAPQDLAAPVARGYGTIPTASMASEPIYNARAAVNNSAPRGEKDKKDKKSKKPGPGST